VTRNLAIDRAHVDDRGPRGIGAARLDQERNQRLCSNEHAFHVHAHRHPKIFDRRIEKVTCAHHPRVVDEDIELLELAADVTRHLTPLLRGRHVHRLAMNGVFLNAGKRGQFLQLP
jgi:hypothetical protein